MKRAYQRTLADKALLIAGAFVALFTSLIVGSFYYNTPSTTTGFFSRSGVMFFVMLFTSLQALEEISLLYAQRPIVVSPCSITIMNKRARLMFTVVSEQTKVLRHVSPGDRSYCYYGRRISDQTSQSRDPGHTLLLLGKLETGSGSVFHLSPVHVSHIYRDELTISYCCRRN